MSIDYAVPARVLPVHVLLTGQDVQLLHLLRTMDKTTPQEIGKAISIMREWLADMSDANFSNSEDSWLVPELMNNLDISDTLTPIHYFQTYLLNRCAYYTISEERIAIQRSDYPDMSRLAYLEELEEASNQLHEYLEQKNISLSIIEMAEALDVIGM